jgi:hypothetical protein
VGEAVVLGHAVVFLAKPFDVDELVVAVRAAAADYFASH